MNKKIISLLLTTVVCCTALVSCGNSNESSSVSSPTENSRQSTSDNNVTEPVQSSAIMDSPTVDVKKIVSISDFKDKDSKTIAALLGNPTNETDNVSTYEKDGYIFEITYFNSVCGKMKITPKAEMKYPADATNSLKVLNITAGDADSLSPASLTWNNKFDAYSISVVPDDTIENKLGYISVVLSEQYK